MLVITLTAITLCSAQKIEIKEASGRYKYTLNGKRMTMGRLVNTMQATPNALRLITKAQTNNTYTSILGIASGFLIGFPIGQFMSGKEANWTLAGIGTGLAVISIPISLNVNKKTKKAVDIYNSLLN